MDGLLFWRFRVRMGHGVVYTWSGAWAKILHSWTGDMVTRLSSRVSDVATRRPSLSVLVISIRDCLAEMFFCVGFHIQLWSALTLWHSELFF